jgi:RHS repeat-associated protein
MTVSDRKLPAPSSVVNSVVPYYTADIMSNTDYYPFGQEMPGRVGVPAGGGYRFGYNGKEQDPEMKGEDNSYNYGARMYDPRLARFASCDPISFAFTWQSPYAYSLNSPITFIDKEGAGPSKPNPGSNTGTTLTNTVIGFVNFVHPLIAIALSGDEKKPLDPKKDVSEFGHANNQGRNFENTYWSIVPGQTTLWYNDNNEYDVIEIWIPNPSPPPADILLWTTGQSPDPKVVDDDRQKDASGHYLATKKDPQFMNQESDLDLKHYSNVYPKGWGSYRLPASVTQFRINIYANNAPNYTFEARPPSSVWLFYVRNATDKKPPAKEENEYHQNVRYMWTPSPPPPPPK